MVSYINITVALAPQFKNITYFLRTVPPANPLLKLNLATGATLERSAIRAAAENILIPVKIANADKG